MSQTASRIFSLPRSCTTKVSAYSRVSHTAAPEVSKGVKTDGITRMRLSDGKVLGQVKTHTPHTAATTNAYSSNLQDYLRVSEGTAWVTRNQPDLDPTVAEIDRSNDLLRINPTSMERTDERIDLSLLDTKDIRGNPDTGKGQEVAVYARQ